MEYNSLSSKDISNKNITNLKSSLFYNDLTIKNFIIPSYIKVIESRAFEGCLNLEEVFIPSSVTHINPLAFLNCSKLKKINILNNECWIYFNAFYGTPYYNIMNEITKYHNNYKKFITFLNEINEDKNSIFKYVRDGILNLKDVDFLLDEKEFKGFKEGVNYGV